MALKVGELFAVLGLDAKAYDKGLDNARERGESWVGGIEGASKKAAIALAGVGAIAAAGIAVSTSAAMGYEKQISAVGAVSGATAEELRGLNEAGLRIGAETAFSAAEAASAMETLAANGISARDIMDGAADAAVALAAAGGTDLTTAADAASTSMAVWGLKATELTDVVNRLAGAANVSRFGVEDMAGAIAQGGGAAATAGVEFGDFATAIAAIAPSFSSGSDAGTSFKTMLMALTPNSKEAAKTMRELGLIAEDGANQFYDSQGNLKSFAEITDILNKATRDLTEEQKSNALTTIFGSDAMRAASAISKITGDEFAAMSRQMGDTSAADVAAQRMDNAAGAMEALQGAIESISIEIGQRLTPAVKVAALWLADNLPAAFDKVAGAVEWAANHMDIVIPALLAFAGAIAGAVVPAMVAWATTAWAAATAMIAALAGPMLIGAAIGLLIAGIILLVKHWDTISAKAQEFAGIVRDRVVEAFEYVRERVVSAFEYVRDSLASAWESIKDAVAGAWEWIVGKVRDGINGIVNLFTFLYEHVGRFQQLVDFLVAVFRFYVDFYRGAWELISSITIAVVSAIWTFITERFTELRDWLADVWNTISGAIGAAWDAISGVVSDGASAVWEVVSREIGRVVDFFRGLGSMILGALGDFGNLLYEVGRDIVRGLARGIENMVGWLMDKVRAIADGIKNMLVWALDIHSPSRVMAGIGRNIAAGLAVGMEDGSGRVASAARSMSDSVVGPEGAGFPAGAPRGGFGGGTVIHVTVEAPYYTGPEHMLAEPVKRVLRLLETAGDIAPVLH